MRMPSYIPHDVATCHRWLVSWTTGPYEGASSGTQDDDQIGASSLERGTSHEAASAGLGHVAVACSFLSLLLGQRHRGGAHLRSRHARSTDRLHTFSPTLIKPSVVNRAMTPLATGRGGMRQEMSWWKTYLETDCPGKRRREDKRSGAGDVAFRGRAQIVGVHYVIEAWLGLNDLLSLSRGLERRSSRCLSACGAAGPSLRFGSSPTSQRPPFPHASPAPPLHCTNPNPLLLKAGLSLSTLEVLATQHSLQRSLSDPCPRLDARPRTHTHHPTPPTHTTWEISSSLTSVASWL